VFVLQAPYLLFYPDRNKDDVPDANPEVVLFGFGMEDAHSVANSLTWGPDGWLYGLQGSTVTAQIRGISFQQGVWRYHPMSKRFELFAEGGGNMWGLDFDRHGNLFASTNVGGYVMLHAVQGAYYWKSFGKHGELHNPFAFGYFDHVPHAGVQGGHVAVGGLFYEGDALPAMYRGKYFAADLLDHSAHWHELEPQGSTFRARQMGDLLRANDTWFAPSDMALGPDGAIYIADWHDRRTAHPDPDAEWDRSNGRIYALVAKDAEPKSDAPLDMNALGNDALVKLLEHPNMWYVRKARRLLAERRAADALEAPLERVRDGRGGPRSLEIVLANYGAAGIDPPLARELLAHKDPDIRAWTVRMLGDENQVGSEFAARLAKLAADEPTAQVRAQLATSARRLPPPEGLPIVARLLERDQDGADPFLPLLLWWAVESHARYDRNRVIDYFTSPQAWKSGMSRTVVIPRLTKFLASFPFRGALAFCEELLRSAPTPLGQAMAAAALDEGLRGRRTRRFPDSLREYLAQLWKADPSDLTKLRLAARARDPSALKIASALAFNARAPENARVSLLDLWADIGDAASVSPLLEAATTAQSDAVALAAMQTLSHFDDASIPVSLLQAYPRKSARWRSAALDLLLDRAEWAMPLLRAVDAGRIAPADVSLQQVARVALFFEPELDRLVRKHWGTLKGPTPEEKLAEVRRLNNDLRAGTGDPERGRALFLQHCASCHRLFGEGNAVGPELTHANRGDRDYLLVSLVDPSGTIRKEYQSVVIHTRDGRTLAGLPVSQTPENVILVDAKNERTTIPRAEIDEVQESHVSLMPDGLYKLLNPHELRDLFTYLQLKNAPERGAQE
jgi:putative membrane-bound dehydrogenase-like protein